jgi:hypothetical protein
MATAKRFPEELDDDAISDGGGEELTEEDYGMYRAVDVRFKLTAI